MALTKHEEGSLRELAAISFPLMLSSLSVLFMVFADRWFLAQYSISAHNAAVSATTFAWGFIFGWMSLAGIAEVFVAQYNGAGLRHKLGEPVWQMIWLSVLSWSFFLPVSFWGTDLLFGEGVESVLERDYFRIMVLYGPFYALEGALCSFFVGQGQIKLVTCSVLAANLCNILLDWLLIFGVEGWIPSMGVKGAAIATNMATLLQGLILGAVFLSKRNRLECGTTRWRPRLKPFLECVKIGLPTSIVIVAELTAYGLYYAIMKERGPVHITVAGICQTFIILFFFFAEGSYKATAAIAGNMIGAARSQFISKVMRAGMILNVCFLAFLILCCFFGSGAILEQFLPFAEPQFIEEVKTPLEISLVLFAFYLFFESLRMQAAGILTASGDTVFLLRWGVVLVWSCMLLPVYISIGREGASVIMGAVACVFYSVVAWAVYFWRIKRNLQSTIARLVDV
jgi:MATE family multidrug resistance protein